MPIVDRIDRLLIIAQLLQLTPGQLRDRDAALSSAAPPAGWESAATGVAFHAQMAAALAPLRVEFDDDARWLSLGELLSEGVEIQQAAHRVRTGWRRNASDSTPKDDQAPGPRVPPAPWAWQRVAPQPAEGSKPISEQRGEALVASDGTWLIWAESGYIAPEVHPAVKDLLARAWQLPRESAPARPAFDADLNWEDDDANNIALLTRADFDPTVIYPGALLWAGQPGALAEVEVLGTQLRLGVRNAGLVLVTFRQTAIRSRKDALGDG